MSPRGAAYNAMRRERSRRALVDAALEEFAVDGYRGASVARIAARAGVSKALTYTHFSGKEELLLAILEQRADEVISVLESLPDAPPAEQLRALVGGLLDHAAANVPLYRMYVALFLQPGAGPALEQAGARLGARGIALQATLLDLLTRMQVEDPGAEAAFLQAALNGVLMRLVLEPEGFPREALEGRLLRVADGARGARRH